jgi:hypothetical protein
MGAMEQMTAALASIGDQERTELMAVLASKGRPRARALATLPVQTRTPLRDVKASPAIPCEVVWE